MRSWADALAQSSQVKKSSSSTTAPKPQTVASAPIKQPGKATNPSTKSSTSASPSPAPTPTPTTQLSPPKPAATVIPSAVYSLPITKKKSPLGQVLVDYNLENADEPPVIYSRGIINTGNICFMNSILQALIHCVPFHQLLSYIGQNSIHSIQSDTPLLDALIELVGEFEYAPTNSNSAESELRAIADGLTNVNLTPLSPESFYNKLRALPRFQHLKRGRQEDAEEFLGYLLEALHDEFTRAMKPFVDESKPTPAVVDNDDEWQEVGKNNRKLQVRQSTGFGQTPITQLFGGQFKSILSVAKQKSPSITRDPFQHVQLDISDPAVHSIEDAFLHLAHLEELQYTTSLKQEVRATKQILIDAVPKILIIHLKRFAYTSGHEDLGGVQKITKPISFPEDLVIPPEALSRSLVSGSGRHRPEYKLYGVVYHHGLSAGAGHYTVDVRESDAPETNQIGNKTDEWINIDDIALTKTGTPLSPSGSPPPQHVSNSTSRNGTATSSSWFNSGSSKTAYILFYVQNNY